MVNVEVLLLESGRVNASSFAPALQKRGYTVIIAHTIREAVQQAQSIQPGIVVLNAASLKASGARLCRQLRAALKNTPILLVVDHRHEPDPLCGASVVLALPFTPRKLLNHVARLLPGDESTCLQAGPIKLDLARQRVICGGRAERVTHKQAKLLELFLRAPGQLVTRAVILKRVWETDYLGDTRTLDVHISWLRRVIEPNPRQPRYLQTVRGMGYRLVVPAG